MQSSDDDVGSTGVAIPPEAVKNLPSIVTKVKKMVDQAETIPEITKAMNAAEVITVILRIGGWAIDVQNEVAEQKLLAERKGGEVLLNMEQKGEISQRGKTIKNYSLRSE